jgi:hypothetical protein
VACQDPFVAVRQDGIRPTEFFYRRDDLLDLFFRVDSGVAFEGYQGRQVDEFHRAQRALVFRLGVGFLPVPFRHIPTLRGGSPVPFCGGIGNRRCSLPSHERSFGRIDATKAMRNQENNFPRGEIPGNANRFQEWWTA